MQATLVPTETLAVAGGATWEITRVAEIDSTNKAAARLPAWSALFANTQSGGYGRTGRAWTSDPGGLWFSAVLPFGEGNAPWALMPLVAGCALAEWLARHGVRNHRVRWPNDLMIGSAKLAGILVERHQPGTVVLGIGLNVLNDPAATEAALKGQVTNLSQHWDFPRSLRELSHSLLSDLAEAHQRFVAHGFEPFARSLNLHWTRSCLVNYQLVGECLPRRARFLGIETDGRLEVLADDGRLVHLDPVKVEWLREL
ncbi:biotin--[acetyl-CoA-carboxylase] ligase [Nibricoccus sp. IMCC34717]|uniref:biotin--[acetyl-CoA-carboxylase] ligase n=1 Tax=Nibricoccus sp. IMCC34717 TaxID=3034021 RepID=UPI00384FCFE5